MAAALERQRIQGGRVGENLVALGAIDADLLNGFLRRSLDGPKDIEATGIDEADLLALLMKLIYSYRLEKVGQFTDAFKLSQNIVMDLTRLAVGRQLHLDLPEEITVVAVEASDCATIGGVMHPEVRSAVNTVVNLVRQFVAVRPQRSTGVSTNVSR